MTWTAVSRWLAPLAGKGLQVGLAVLLAVSLWAGWSTHKWRQTAGNLADSRGEIVTLKAAAETNADAARKIRDRLQAEVDRQRASLAAERRANTELEQRLAGIAARAEQLRRERDDIFRDDGDCEVWGAEHVCPGIADSLRDLTGSGD